MAWTKFQMFLAGLLIVTGSINTLATKYADESDAAGRKGGFWKNATGIYPTDEPHKFNHPFLQATGMFVGEFSCLVFFKIRMLMHSQTAEQDLPDMLKGNRNFNPFIFYLPALADMVGTSLMYVGLTMTYASSFQMFRGAVIIFTGLFSMFFLKRRLHRFKWLGILFVLLGLVLVGLADILKKGDKDSDEPEHSNTAVMTGNLIIVLAQIVSATQMVLEEKFVSQSDVPALQAVGWEGFFGMTTLGILLIPMYFIRMDGQVPFEDSVDGLIQIFTSGPIAAGFGGTLISISFFNFAGISVTKQLSATTRMVLDSVRTIVIWVISLATGQEFSFITLGGFVVLLAGMSLYNNILFVPLMAKQGWIRNPEDDEEEEDDRQTLEQSSA